MRPSRAQSIRLLDRGSRECRALDAPAASHAKIIKHTSIVTTVTPDSPGIPRAMVLTVSFVISPVIGLFVTVVSGIASANLTPASRRQDHTTSPSASRSVRQRCLRVHRIPSRVRDDREPPLDWDETARVIILIWVRDERNYFRKWDWTAQGRFARQAIRM